MYLNAPSICSQNFSVLCWQVAANDFPQIKEEKNRLLKYCKTSCESYTMHLGLAYRPEEELLPVEHAGTYNYVGSGCIFGDSFFFPRKEDWEDVRDFCKCHMWYV